MDLKITRNFWGNSKSSIKAFLGVFFRNYLVAKNLLLNHHFVESNWASILFIFSSKLIKLRQYKMTDSILGTLKIMLINLKLHKNLFKPGQT